MAEHDAFERRISDALRTYAGEMRTRVDAAAVADRVAGERARRWTGVQVPGFGPFPRIVWILVAAALLAIAGGIVVVGSGLPARPRILGVITNQAIWERVYRPGTEGVYPLNLLGVSATEAWGLWVGASSTDTSEILHFQGDAVSPETVGHSAPAVRDLALAPDGTLWAATAGGVAARIDGTWTIVDEQPALGVAVASDGTVWVGGKGSKVWTVRPAGAGWEVRDVPDAATGSSTTPAISRKVGPTMAVDRAGHLWVSGGNQGWFETPGLLRFDGERWEAMRPVEESSGAVFGNVVAAPDGAVWVTIDRTSTPGNCCRPADPATQVARFDGGRWEVFGTANGLPSDNVELSLAVGPDDTAWLSTTHGLFSFDGKRWSPVLEGEAYGRVSAAPDGTLWLSGLSVVARISAPTR